MFNRMKKEVLKSRTRNDGISAAVAVHHHASATKNLLNATASSIGTDTTKRPRQHILTVLGSSIVLFLMMIVLLMVIHQQPSSTVLTISSSNSNTRMVDSTTSSSSTTTTTTTTTTTRERAAGTPKAETSALTSTASSLPSSSSSLHQRQQRPHYSGYTFWSSDLHIAPVGDLRALFTPMNMSIMDKSLSGHCSMVNTCQKDLKILPNINVFELTKWGTKEGTEQDCKNDIRREFYNVYHNDTEMNTIDAFLCHHLTSICELFMAFDRPLIFVVSTRYELGRGHKDLWPKFNENIRAIASNPRNVVAANNKFDAEYLKYFTGLKDVPVIQNYCEYVNVDEHLQPNRTEFLVGPSRNIDGGLMNELVSKGKEHGNIEFANIRQLYGSYKYSDLANHPGIVLMPYQVSIMSIFEYYRMNLPMFVPSIPLITIWHRQRKALNEITWMQTFNQFFNESRCKGYGNYYPYDPNDDYSNESFQYWIQFADFYVWPHVITFDSWDDLMIKIEQTNLTEQRHLMRMENARLKQELIETWQNIFHGMFYDHKPTKKVPRPYEPNWDIAMMKNYGIQTGPCYQQDIHTRNYSHLLM